MKENIVYSLINYIFNNSKIFNNFRNIVHSNFKDEKYMISKNVEKNKITLDFGCGAGQFSDLFNSNKYYGIDTDVNYINFCKKNHRGNFLKINYSPPYNLKSGYFDQILISSVIHHINDNNLLLILKELKRILNKKGKLILIDHFTKKNQKNIFCKFLIDLDRGNYFRDLNESIKLFSGDFKVEKTELFRNSVYNDYLIILSKK